MGVEDGSPAGSGAGPGRSSGARADRRWRAGASEKAGRARAMTLPSGGLAVMQNRRDPPNSLDDSPTPPWATRALLRNVLMARELSTPHQSVWEPACGRGLMSAVLAEHFVKVIATDVFDYGIGAPT